MFFKFKMRINPKVSNNKKIILDIFGIKGSKAIKTKEIKKYR